MALIWPLLIPPLADRYAALHGLEGRSTWLFMANAPHIDPDEQFGFNDNPMAVREFLDAHNAINTPWFRIRFFFALWRERICDWFRGALEGELGSEMADGRDRSCKP